jgi:predicted nucleotidyltransferase
MTTLDNNLYLIGVLNRYSITPLQQAEIVAIQQVIFPVIRAWGKHYIADVSTGGSHAKGTAVRGGTDIDFFVSLSSTATQFTLANIYDTLFADMKSAGFNPRRQNVSMGINIGGKSVDIVPARRQSQYGGDHWLYSTKRQTHMQTNIQRHISEIQNSGRIDEIRLMKAWRNRKGLDFPSFYLELVVLRALHGRLRGDLANNVVAVLVFIRDQLATTRIVDPSNTNNIISDQLNPTEKATLALSAGLSLNSPWTTEFA